MLSADAQRVFDAVMAALRAGHRMQLGGGRSFATYAMAGEKLVVIQSDDGFTEEHPCDPGTLAEVVAEHLPVFSKWAGDTRWLDGVVRVLREVWDPIGRSRLAALPANEYARYAPAVLALLANGSDDDAIAALLEGFETTSMGLAARPRRSLDATVAALRAVPREPIAAG